MDTRHWWVVLLVIAVALTGSMFDATRGLEAALLAVGAPALALVLASAALRGSSRPIAAAGIAVAVATLVLAELDVMHTLRPPAPVAEVELSVTRPEASVAVPPGLEALEVEVHASLGRADASASGHAVVELRRGGTSETLRAEFQRSTSRGRASGRGTRGGGSNTFDTARADAVLPGEGPVMVRLVDVQGSIGRHVKVAVRPPVFLGGHHLAAFALLGVIGVAVEFAESRRGRAITFAAAVVFASALALGVRSRYTDADPLAGVFSALLLAAVFGGVAALVVGGISRRLRAVG